MAAALALLPAFVALLFGLLDAGAHAFLGLSGAFLSVAGALLPGALGGLPAYRTVAVAVPIVVATGVARAAAPVAMAVLAARTPSRRCGRLALFAAAVSLATAGNRAGCLLVTPGLLGALLLARGSADNASHGTTGDGASSCERDPP